MPHVLRLSDYRQNTWLLGVWRRVAARFVNVGSDDGIILGMEDKLLYRDEVYAIQGAVFEVYKEMGNAWHEEVYQQCLERELADRGIPFEAKKELPIYYKGKPIKKTYEPDVFCFGKIILELKAVDALADEHRRQILNYLRITHSRLGLLINFGAYPRVAIERFAL